MPTQPTKSLTPRTDDLKRPAMTFEGKEEVVSAKFMEQEELRLNAALAENEELRKDKERLDIVQEHQWELAAHYNGLDESKEIGRGNSIRKAIDSVIQSTNKPK